MKLCKDCKFIKVDPISRFFGYWDLGLCTSPSRPFYPASSSDPVTGNVTPARQMATCFSNRLHDCGADAAFFESKRPADMVVAA